MVLLSSSMLHRPWLWAAMAAHPGQSPRLLEVTEWWLLAEEICKLIHIRSVKIDFVFLWISPPYHILLYNVIIESLDGFVDLGVELVH